MQNGHTSEADLQEKDSDRSGQRTTFINTVTICSQARIAVKSFMQPFSLLFSATSYLTIRLCVIAENGRILSSEGKSNERTIVATVKTISCRIRSAAAVYQLYGG
jgi:hypothetical protein